MSPKVPERYLSEAIRIKQIGSNEADLNSSLNKLKHNFKKQRYHLSLIIKHLENIDLLDRTDLIVEKDTQQKSDRISLVITYDRFLLNIIKILW